MRYDELSKQDKERLDDQSDRIWKELTQGFYVILTPHKGWFKASMPMPLGSEDRRDLEKRISELGGKLIIG